MSPNHQPITYLFVDGSNLYGSQYELFGPKQYLNFAKFRMCLETILKVQFSQIFFYASYSPKPLDPTPKQLAFLKNEGLFYHSVKNTPKLTFFKGYRSKTSGKEKEVDVKLAVDIVDFAWQNKYQNAYILTGDADFMHALIVGQRLKKRIELLCMSNNIMYKGSFYYDTHILHGGMSSQQMSKVSTNLSKKFVHWHQLLFPIESIT